MSKFEVVSKYQDQDIHLPKRATGNAAGYDFEVAEDIIVPSYLKPINQIRNDCWDCLDKTLTLEEISKITKKTNSKPTLVPTGIKCQLESYQYLELSVRSSLPLKHWLILANGVGIIDADYYNNPGNEGHIYFQLINLSPFDLQLKKGDRIGQGIIKTYGTVEGDYYGQGKQRVGGFGSSTMPHDEILEKLKEINRQPITVLPMYETHAEPITINPYQIDGQMIMPGYDRL